MCVIVVDQNRWCASPAAAASSVLGCLPPSLHRGYSVHTTVKDIKQCSQDHKPSFQTHEWDVLGFSMNNEGKNHEGQQWNRIAVSRTKSCHNELKGDRRYF